MNSINSQSGFTPAVIVVIALALIGTIVVGLRLSQKPTFQPSFAQEQELGDVTPPAEEPAPPAEEPAAPPANPPTTPENPPANAAPAAQTPALNSFYDLDKIPLFQFVKDFAESVVAGNNKSDINATTAQKMKAIQDEFDKKGWTQKKYEAAIDQAVSSTDSYYDRKINQTQDPEQKAALIAAKANYDQSAKAQRAKPPISVGTPAVQPTSITTTSEDIDGGSSPDPVTPIMTNAYAI